MTTSEILLLFQTIIALLALLVSVVHLMDDRKKDDSYGSKGKSTKEMTAQGSQPVAVITFVICTDSPFLIFIIDSKKTKKPPNPTGW